MTPCEEKGYKVGDLFEVIKKDEYSLGSIVKLTEDDGSEWPLFDLVKGSVLSTIHPNDTDFYLGFDDFLPLARKDKDQDTEHVLSNIEFVETKEKTYHHKPVDLPEIDFTKGGLIPQPLNLITATAELERINSNQVAIDARKQELESYVKKEMELVGATVSFGGDTDPESLAITEAHQLKKGDVIEIVKLGNGEVRLTEGQRYEFAGIDVDGFILIKESDNGSGSFLFNDTTWRFISQP
tara:strand:+ start:48009 stop:48725 length:717 start_codon:yes stop_codon:yes gene_type:complete